MKKNKRNKFNVDTSDEGKLKRTYNGVLYDSELEMKAYKDWIEPMLDSGEIIKVERQVKYTIQERFTANGKTYRPIIYTSDFDLYYPDGKVWVVDIKGYLKPTDRLHEKMLRYKHRRINFDFIGYSPIDGGWVPIDKIIKGRRERFNKKHTKGEKE